MSRKHVAILISGRGSNMMSLVEAARDPNYPAEVILVISNRPEAPGLAWAAAQGLPTKVIDHKSYPNREDFDAALHEALVASGAEIVCCAGFMRLMTAGFVEKWSGRMLNIHPSLLPAFPGLNAQRQAIEYGVKFSGCTVHLVDEELDHGPIVKQGVVPLLPGDTEETLSARILIEEHKIYAEAVALMLRGRFRIEGRRVIELS